MRDSLWVILPCYNEAPTVPKVLEEVCRVVPQEHIVVVDDGSTDHSRILAREHARHVIVHRINRGLGAALQTGVQFALAQGAQIIVTMDADGQHHAQEIPALVAPIISANAEMVIGSRFLRKQSMPLLRRVFNSIANVVTWLVHGRFVSDSQSGFRAFSRDALLRMRMRANRMDISSEFIKEAHRLQLRLIEVPITSVYTQYSLSKGQNFVGGVRTFWSMLIRKAL